MKLGHTDWNVPEPASPWSEITPRLWMGGHVWQDPDGALRAAVAGDEFDLVVSLVAAEGHGPDGHVEHLVAPLPDGPLEAEQIRTVQDLARTVAQAMRDGRVVLVRCRSGYNRSGLIVAQTLIELGDDASGAIDLIRRRRSAWALHNDIFVQYLITGLDVAGLLVGLGTPDLA